MTTLFLVLAAIIGGILFAASRKPEIFLVERSATLQAAASDIYPHLVDFREWGKWSPWEKLDPALRRTYSGSDRGVGAVYAWVGNKKVGEGRMEILEALPDAAITIKLDFLKPFEAHNVTELTLNPSGASTVVRWRMTGPNAFMGKLMSVFVNMDAMVGKDFETGLANLRAVVERE